VGSTHNTSFLGLVIKYGGDSLPPYAKIPATAGLDPTGFVKYDAENYAIPEFK
jgi:hypothetical protein